MKTDTQQQTRHTPGPWTFDKSYIHGPRGKRFLAVASDDEGKANARLIAAAPDLLMALRAIYGAHIAPPGATIGEARLCGMFAELAREAIAKAEGRA